MRLEYQRDYTQQTAQKLGPTSVSSIFNSPSESIFHERQRSDTVNGTKKKDLFHLRKLITKHKVRILSNNFVSKLRQNNTHRKPPDLNFLQSNEQLNLYDNLLKKLENTQGLILGNVALTTWSFVNIIQITMMVFIFSINIVFKQTQDNQIFLQFRIFSIILYVVDMLLNFSTQRFQNGRRLINLRDIGQFYISSGFFVDFISIAMFPIYLVVDSEVTIFISFVALIKLWNSVKKFQKFQYLYIKSNQKQHYYGLIKVFITNFVIGHFLSILLNLMATANYDDRNWHRTINITDASWFIKYVWGYYWGTNIMLTVGFGDLVATTHTQAIFLIFIETFSCITLAYNISTVGSLMSELKSKDQKKKKQLKIFHRMSQENQISNELTTRISNFIEQSFQIRETFEFQEEDQVIKSLPTGIQSQFRIQANKILFDNIGFLNNMSSKTLVNLAQNIQRKISHPEEIIKKKGNLGNFTIISNGSIGLCCRKQYSLLNGQTIQKLTVQKGGKPKLISLDFIKGKFYQFDIKSLGYSIVYFLQRSKFMQCLKDFQLDYQFFCTMRDRDQYLFGENQLYHCSICKTQYHNKFNCHRLHFVPIKQHVITKRNAKQPKCRRRCGISRQPRNQQGIKQVLKIYTFCKQQYQKFLHHHFGKIYIEKLLMSKQYFQKTNRIRSMSQKLGGRRVGLLRQKQTLQRSDDQASVRCMTQSNMSNIDGVNQLQQNYEKIEKLLLREQNEFKDFWDLQVDQIHNFKYYFTSFNAQNLGSKDKIKQEGSFRFII